MKLKFRDDAERQKCIAHILRKRDHHLEDVPDEFILDSYRGSFVYAVIDLRVSWWELVQALKDALKIP